MSFINVVVTRHSALVDYLRELNLVSDDVRIIDHASPEDVTNVNVAGVLPHHLSVLTTSYTEVPLIVPQELRGTELNIDQIRQYAGEPRTYIVSEILNYD